MSKDNNVIAVQPRSEFGNNAARRARRAGLVPGNIYGKDMEGSKAIYMNAGEWSSVARHKHHLLYLLDGDQKQPVLVKEIQINHLKNYFLHVDFQAVAADEVVHTTVAIHALGDSVGVAHGGIFEQLVHEIPVYGKPGDLVDEVKVDVSALEIGSHIMVKDIQLPAGLTAHGDLEAVVFAVAMPQKEEEAPAPAAAATEPEVTSEKKPADDAAAADAKGGKADAKSKK